MSWRDLHHSLRALARTPAFAATAFLTLALAVAANATLFAFMNALLWRPLPVKNPEQLVSVSTVFRNGMEERLSFPMFREFERRQGVFSSVIGWFGNPVLNVEANGALSPATVIGVTGNFYSELGVSPTTGRLLVPGDMNLEAFRTAGNTLWMRMAGRMRPGVSVEQTRAHLESIWPHIKAAVVPSTHQGAQRANFLAMRLSVQSLEYGVEPFLRQRYTRPLYFLLGISLVVTLIASVNLASLMLPRVASRAHEVAVRTALGASGWQAARGVFIETTVLGFAAAAAGLALTMWWTQGISAAILPPSPVPLARHGHGHFDVERRHPGLAGDSARCVGGAAPIWPDYRDGV
jgi:hypothetical protein